MAKKLTYSFLLLSGIALAAILGFPRGNIQEDSIYYRWLAEGKFNLVIQPFASRGLEPAIVRLTDHLFHTPPDLIFYLLSILSLTACIGGTAYLASRYPVRNNWLFVLPFLPVWTLLFHAYILPDIFHAALLTAFCALLARQKYELAALLLMPLYAARESSSLIFVCFAFAAWGIVKFRVILLALLATVAGYGAEKWLVLGTGGNRHGISQLAYFAGKVPYNVMKNFVGFSFWSNILQDCTPTSV